MVQIRDITRVEEGHICYTTIHPKSHSYVILTQIKIKQDLQKYGEKGNDTIHKELRQSHNKETLLTIKREDILYKEWNPQCLPTCRYGGNSKHVTGRDNL